MTAGIRHHQVFVTDEGQMDGERHNLPAETVRCEDLLLMLMSEDVSGNIIPKVAKADVVWSSFDTSCNTLYCRASFLRPRPNVRFACL